jgi:hypothetical protein
MLVDFMAIALWPCYTPEIGQWFPGNVRGGLVGGVVVLFAAGGKQDGHYEDGDDDRDDDERGRDAHSRRLLNGNSLTVASGQLSGIRDQGSGIRDQGSGTKQRLQRSALGFQVFD